MHTHVNAIAMQYEAYVEYEAHKDDLNISKYVLAFLPENWELLDPEILPLHQTLYEAKIDILRALDLEPTEFGAYVARNQESGWNIHLHDMSGLNIMRAEQVATEDAVEAYKKLAERYVNEVYRLDYDERRYLPTKPAA